MNPTRIDSGRDALIEETLVLVPDIIEAADRLDAIQAAIAKDLINISASTEAFMASVRSLRVHSDMLRNELRDDRAEILRRKEAALEVAEKLGYKNLPEPPEIRVLVPINTGWRGDTA